MIRVKIPMRCRLFSILALVLLPACTRPSDPVVVSNDDAAVKIRAMKQAARLDDLSVLTQIVRDLESDDAAVRFYAIRTLQDLTSQTFNYRYYDDEDARRPAVRAWRQWLAAQRTAASQPATIPAATIRTGE